MPTYKLSPLYSRHPELFHNVKNGEVVNLLGNEYTKDVPATNGATATQIKVRGANQEDYKYIYEVQGNKRLIVIDKEGEGEVSSGMQQLSDDNQKKRKKNP